MANGRAERAYRNEHTTQHHLALTLGFRRTAELTIRGGGYRKTNMALMSTERMGPPPGASPPMRMTASWSGSKRTYRIQVCSARSALNDELPSDLSADRHRQTPELCKPLSQFIILPRAQASRRCETQAPLSGKPPSCASVSVP